MFIRWPGNREAFTRSRRCRPWLPTEEEMTSDCYDVDYAKFEVWRRTDEAVPVMPLVQLT